MTGLCCGREGGSVLRLLADQSGVVIVEYALFLSIASVAAFSVAFAFANVSSTQVSSQATQLNSYATNPQSYECSAGLTSSC